MEKLVLIILQPKHIRALDAITVVSIIQIRKLNAGTQDAWVNVLIHVNPDVRIHALADALQMIMRIMEAIKLVKVKGALLDVQ